MNLNKLILTKNNCYKTGRAINVKGIMVHSTGANNPWLKRYLPDDGKIGKNQYGNHWNTPLPGGIQVCVHGFIGKLADRTYFNTVYKEATELCAYLCKEFGLTEKDIIDHSEGYKKGIASNHGDVKHWFTKHGKTMDNFRADVKKLLNNQKTENKELISVNDIVWELSHRGIITDKELWLAKLEEDKNSYWLARKTVKYLQSKSV